MESDSKMSQMFELVDTDFKAAALTMVKDKGINMCLMKSQQKIKIILK